MAENRLIELARQVSIAELREECARVRAAADPDPDATNRRIHQQRRLRHYSDAEGGWNLSARGTAQDGAAFTTVLNAITDDVFAAARRAGRHEPVEAYAFDALLAMAEHAAGGHQSAVGANRSAEPAADTTDGDEPAGHAASRAADLESPDPADADPATCDEEIAASTVEPTSAGFTSGSMQPTGSTPVDTPDAAAAGQTAGGDPGLFRRAAARPVCPAPPRRWSNPRYLALVRIDAEALRRGRVEGEELCEIAGVGPIPVSVARDLLGDAIVKLVITTGVDLANVTHLGRGPTTAQKIALMWTTPTCTVLGCHRRRIEYDHQKPWAETRHTPIGRTRSIMCLPPRSEDATRLGSGAGHGEARLRATRRP